MICTGCHGIDDAMANCARCSGKGGVCEWCDKPIAAGFDLCFPCYERWKREQMRYSPEEAPKPVGEPEEKNLTADGAEDADKTKEDKVKTFAERLDGFKVRIMGKIDDTDMRTAKEAPWLFLDVLQAGPAFAPEQRVLNLLVRTLAMLKVRRRNLDGWVNILHLEKEVDAVLELLKQKNASYGDTALNPKRYFATGSALDMLLVRIDDKLNRIFTAADAFGEDALLDLAGYLVLAYLAMEDEWDAAARAGTYCPTHRMRWNRCGCEPKAIAAKSAKKEEADTDCTDSTDGQSRCIICGERPCATEWDRCHQCLDQGLF